MDSMDGEAITSRFVNKIKAHREKIALQWYLAIASTSSLIPSRTDSLEVFSKLVERIITFLTDPSQSKKDGWVIGQSLAELHCIQPEIMDITGQLWVDIVVGLATKEELSFLYPRLTLLFYVMASGYFRKSREIILSEQEQIRQALIFNIATANKRLEDYQLHLEEILLERTKELQEKEEQYRLITETSMLGIYQLDASRRFRFINQAFSNMVGYSRREIIGKPFRSFIHSDDLTKVEESLKSFLSTGTITAEFALQHKDGYKIDTMIRAVSMPINDQNVIIGFVADITDQKLVESALRASEKRFRTLAETAKDLIIIINREGQITYINSFAADFVQLNAIQMIGQHYTKFRPNESIESLVPYIESVFRSNTALRVDEQAKLSSGIFWLSVSIVPLSDSSGNVSSVFILAKDITDLKKSELALLRSRKQLEKRVLQRTASLAASQDRSRKLARQLVTAQEEERRRVARELHDQAGQALISLKYELDSMYTDLNMDTDSVRKRFFKMMRFIDQTSVQIREISQNLHPPILDIAGINLSIQEYCSELTKRTSLKIDYQGCELTGLPDEIGINLFRILQELLTNILKHSQATSVTVQLKYKKELIILSVKDNGKGIAKKLSKKGLGLLGIQERANILGGDLKIYSQTGRGTEIIISIPWKRDTIEHEK